MEITEIEKIPPQNIEAEMSLLGSLLLDKEAILKVADVIQVEDFYKNSHARIYETMQELYSKGDPIDLLTVGNRLTEKNLLDQIGGHSYLASLSNAVPTASHVHHYAQIIHRKATRRRLISAAGEITKLGFQETQEVDQLLDNAQTHLFFLSPP